MPSKTKKQARFMAMCSHSGGGNAGSGPPCPPKAVAQKFNKADEGGKLLSDAVKDINRTPKNDRFAKGLRSKG